MSGEMTDVAINLTDFNHMKEISVYNHNYYEHKVFKYIIYVVCAEEFECLHFYLAREQENEFLFSSYANGGELHEGTLGDYWC